MDSFLSSIDQPLICGVSCWNTAHLVPKVGWRWALRLFMSDCRSGDAAGLSVNNGLRCGMDLMIGSGICAADAIWKPKPRHFSAQTLSVYQQKMKPFVLKDMRTYAGAPEFMAPRVRSLPADARQHSEDLPADAKPKAHIRSDVIAGFKESKVSLLDLMKDGMKGVSAL